MVIILAAIGIGVYAALYPPVPNSSPTPSPSPTATPVPTSTVIVTPTPNPSAAATPTPTCSVNPTPTVTSTPPEPAIQEKVRDSIIWYIKTYHPETAQFTNDLFWTGGRVTLQGIVGAETYMYYSQGWNVTINYPVVPNPIYNVGADYSGVGISIPYRIIWKGTWRNDVIKETSFIFAQ